MDKSKVAHFFGPPCMNLTVISACHSALLATTVIMVYRAVVYNCALVVVFC